MPGAKNHPATHKERWQAVNLKDLHPKLSYRHVGSKVGRSQTFASMWITLARLQNSVADQSRPGRPHKLDTETTQHILTAAKQKQCKSAIAAIAAKSQQKYALNISVGTVQRALRREGLTAPQAQGCANSDSKTETEKGQIWLCSPENRRSVLAQNDDH